MYSLVLHVQPRLQLSAVLGQPFYIVRYGLQSFGAIHGASASVGILVEERSHFVQFRLCREGLRDGRDQHTEIPVVQGVSIHQELPVRAYPIPDYRCSYRVVGDRCQTA